LEAVVEGNDGRLSRLIFTCDDTLPGIVDTVLVREMNHCDCLVSLLDGRHEPCRITHPKAAGLEQGMIVLLRRVGAAAGDGNRSFSIADIFPGKQRGDIVIEPPPTASPDSRLAITIGTDSMRLRFSLDNGERWVTVHHFSPRLLVLGRRFVADMSSEPSDPAPVVSGETVLLEEVTCLGRLVLLKLSGKSEIMGGCRRVWLRPVLLDGVERYLFYGEAVNRR
jgi:hypothetical protein